MIPPPRLRAESSRFPGGPNAMMPRPSRTLIFRSVRFGIVAAVLYGVVHDQITIQICPEYFTVFHPNLFPTQNLTLLALFWGVFATWWMGAILGGLLGLAAVLGRPPAATWTDVCKVFVAAFVSSAIAALIGGLATAATGLTFPSSVTGPKIAALPFATQQRFAVDLVVHNASYDVSAVVAIIGSIWLYRRRLRTNP